jgi:cytochrome b561
MARLRNTNESYGIIAQSLHWLVAAFVFVQIGLGLYAAALPLSLARLQWPGLEHQISCSGCKLSRSTTY